METGTRRWLPACVFDNKFSENYGLYNRICRMLAEPYTFSPSDKDVTSGYIQKLVLGAICKIRMAVAIHLKNSHQGKNLSYFRYMACIVLSYFVPRLFVGIAFDSGTVSSGPMTATFILAFTQGIAEAVEGANVLIDGFGAVAIVTMTPVITLQILGMIFKIKTRKRDVK